MITAQHVEAFHNLTELLSLGLKQLQKHCSQVYPENSRPIVRKPKESFVLQGGTDPLDYIYVYKNAGKPERNVPRHWHYIGFGLSDIHGYSSFRDHHESLRQENPEYAKSTPPMADIYPPRKKMVSGFGFELTVRVKCNSEAEWHSEPPRWPEKIMQDLARYVFQSRNLFNVGDHVAWHSPLDSSEEGPGSSRIEHVLMTLDPQLAEANTQWGIVRFIQIVGVCSEELEAARQWNVRGILEMMRERDETGGPFLVTDMRRGETIFDLDPEKNERLEHEIQRMGSDMAQISARHKTSYTLPEWFTKAEQEMDHTDDINEQEGGHHMQHEMQRLILRPSDTSEQAAEEEDRPPRPASRMSLGSESGLCIENIDLADTRYYNSIYLLLSHESARVLPVMLNGRLAHKRPFHFQSFKGDSLVTFIPEGSDMESLVEPPSKPFARRGHWLQIYVPNELREQMTTTLMPDFGRTRSRKCYNFEDQDELQLSLPRNYSWSQFNLHLTIVDDIPDDY